MAQGKGHPILEVGGLAIAGFLGYEFVYKPWAANQAAIAAGAAGADLLNPLPGVSDLVTSPSILGTAAPGGIQGSIVDPRVTPGGPVGQAMWLKTWTQAQATQRLNALQAAYTNAMTQAAALANNTANPAAAGIPAAQAQILAEQGALASAQDSYNQLIKAGNTAGAATFAAAIQQHQQDINDLQARINTASTASDNSAAITQWKAAAASADSDYFNLTGQHLN